MRSIILFIIIPIILFSSLYAQNETSQKYVKGEVRLKLHKNFFDFPLEVYGAYIKVQGEQLTIDSVFYLTFKNEYRSIESEKIISFIEFKKQYPNIADKIHLTLDEELLNFFEKYEVHFIGRIHKTFSPDDTLKRLSRRELFNQRFKHLFPNKYCDTIDYSRNVFGPQDKILTVSNANRNLIIKFNPEVDIVHVINELKTIKSVEKVNPSVILDFYGTAQNIPPNDTEYYQQYYYHDFMMDFVGAWQTCIGENGNPLITIAIIDGNFVNADSLIDLSAMFNNNGPTYESDSGDGHGTKVASVAAAFTDNGFLISGASYNCMFMPFTAYNSSELLTALMQIKQYLDDSNPDNDCLVVNMSFGYTPEDDDVTTYLDYLYNNYNLLLVASVAGDGTSSVHYPAYNNSVIGVGASDANDMGLASMSNWGDDVELLATGEQILTVNPSDDYNWGWEWGTSFAAPIVSGLCALAKSHPTGYAKSNDVIRVDLKNGAKIFNEHGKSYYRINAKAALDDVTPIMDEIVINGPTILSPLNN